MIGKRIDNLTGLRGYAALWVVVYHAVILYRPYSEGRGFIGHGFYGVDAFFVLSGFVLSLVYGPRLPGRFSGKWFKPFLVKRLAKIYPMHLLALAGTIAVIGTAQYLHHKPDVALENTPWTALCQVLLLHAFGVTSRVSWNVASWSVSAEWFAYSILFAPMAFGLRQVRWGWVAGLVALLWAAFVYFCLAVLHRDTGLTTIGVLRIIPEFAAGYVLFRWLSVHKVRRGDMLVLLAVGLVVSVCYLPPWYVLLLMPALMLLLAGLYGGGPGVDFLFGNKAALQVGEASYSIYLLQQLVFIGVDQLVKRGLHVGEGMLLSWPWIAAVVATVYSVGRLAFLYIEEPIRVRILERFGADRRNPEASTAAPPAGLHADTETAATIS